MVGGICFGSMSFPEEFAEITEVYYLPSFGVGVSIMVIVNLVVLSVRLSEAQPWHFTACFLPAMASGIIWSIGFLCILYAELVWSFHFHCMSTYVLGH